MVRKVIEENWRAYERDDLPEETGEVELKALRRAFFMGAVLLAPHLDEVTQAETSRSGGDLFDVVYVSLAIRQQVVVRGRVAGRPEMLR